ncbi:MAG: hypothetical protein M5R40_14495 [Anaerolineae bacterium]|nr:hypothetical protein [Anaerolineae bacterium]
MSHKSQRMVTIRIDDASGALTDISGDVDTWSLARTVEALETTAVGDADRAYLPGLHGGALTLGGPFNDTAPQTDAILARGARLQRDAHGRGGHRRGALLPLRGAGAALRVGRRASWPGDLGGDASDHRRGQPDLGGAVGIDAEPSRKQPAD